MTGTQTFSMVDGFTLTINDPNNILGSNQAALLKDANYVIGALNTYLDFVAPLDLRIDVEPASANAGNSDGVLPSSPQWAIQNGQEVLVAAVKGQTGVDLNGSGPDGGFTIYAGNDGTLKNYGSPLWFDPNPQLGVSPSAPGADADFVSIMTHELLHCLGFASWSAVNAPWNQHTYEQNGVWYYKSAAIEQLLGGDLPLAPNETSGQAADHIGDTSISYQPVTSDMMFEWGNYANNRWDFGQVDLIILRDLGWKIQNYQALPLVDPLDSFDVTGTAGNDVLYAPTVSAIISGGDGDDRIVLPAAAGNGNYLIVGGAGANCVVVGQACEAFNLVKYNSDYLLQNKAGLDGVSLLRQIQTVIFSDATVGIDSTDANKTITATASGFVQHYSGALSAYGMSFDGTVATVRAADGTSGTDSLTGVQGIQFSDISFTLAKGIMSGSASSAIMLADLDALQGLAASGHAALSLTDSGTPALSLTAAQAASDAAALAAIVSPVTVVESASGASQAIAAVPGHATIVSFTGNAGQYSVTANGDGSITVAAAGVSDHISGAEQLAFSDLTMTVAPKQSFDEYVALLYQGALGRAPDAGGLQNWEKIANALPASVQASGVYGLSDASGNYNGSLSVAGGFTNSTEFAAKYGSLTNVQFVTQLYSNILDRAPDTAGFNTWMNELGSGQSREHVLVGFAESAEAMSNATQGFTGQSGTHAAWLFLA